MDNNQIVTALFDAVNNNNLDIAGADKKFYTKLVLHAAEIRDLYTQLFSDHPEFSANFAKLIEVLIASHLSRSQDLKDLDHKKPENWYVSNELAGMNVDINHFDDGFSSLPDKLTYFLDLGINVLHLNHFEKDIQEISAVMHENSMFLMLDLDQTNPAIRDHSDPAAFASLLTDIFTHANVGVDILRIAVPELPGIKSQIHTTLQLMKQCLQVTAPGMALAVSSNDPADEVIKFFGEGRYMAKEADFVYNYTQTALQWDALASGQVSAMVEVEAVLLEKPFGTTWITSTRSDHNSGSTLAKLCGFEKAIQERSEVQINMAIQKMLLMQANSFFIGGLPMLSYGDEVADIENVFLPEPKNCLRSGKAWAWLQILKIHAGFPGTISISQALSAMVVRIHYSVFLIIVMKAPISPGIHSVIMVLLLKNFTTIGVTSTLNPETMPSFW
ncbi:hypothetical protein LXM25_23065 [Dyadobacter sp. LJ53]|nr:hypothetical protein [Dyadobacter chenwenxiniae]MCF0052968.1 hypothetical protein [Dyadobacter chenwenxiniae]